MVTLKSGCPFDRSVTLTEKLGDEQTNKNNIDKASTLRRYILSHFAYIERYCPKPALSDLLSLRRAQISDTWLLEYYQHDQMITM